MTDTDEAEVITVDPELRLTKEVDRLVVLPATNVTHTYTATNLGDTDRANPNAAGNPGWVTDDRCASVAYVSGDDGDGLLSAGDPGETWVFESVATIAQDTVNVAEIVAQPVLEGQPQGDPHVRSAVASVLVVAPGIELVKTALTPVVVDPDTQVLDPDTQVVGPAPADPAIYDYVVTNSGDVPLRDVSIEDDTCDPLVLEDRDSSNPGILDVGEVWPYSCSTPLEPSRPRRRRSAASRVW